MNKRTPNFARILAVVGDRPRDEAGGAYRTRPAQTDQLGIDEAEAIVGIAFHMVHADGEVKEDEQHALDALVRHLGRTADEASLRKLVARLGKEAHDDVEEKVRALAATLRRPIARETAYKAAYALRVWDLDASPDEDELDDILVDALDLAEDLAGDLASEVNEALLE